MGNPTSWSLYTKQAPFDVFMPKRGDASPNTVGYPYLQLFGPVPVFSDGAGPLVTRDFD